MVLSVPLSTHQLIKDVSLMDMNGDKRLIFGPFVLAQLLGRHVDQLIEKVQELLICRLHDLPSNHKGDSEEICMTMNNMFPLCSYFQNKSTFLSDLLRTSASSASLVQIIWIPNRPT